MIIIREGNVIIKDEEIFLFVEKNEDNKELLKLVSETFKGIIKVVEEIYKKTDTKKLNTEDLVHKLLEEQSILNRTVKENFDKLSEGIIQNVNSKILELILSINNNMININKNINIEEISAKIIESMNDYMLNNKKDNNKILLEEINEHIKINIIEDINKINKEIEKLPIEINNKIIDNNNIKALEKMNNEIEEIKNNIRYLDDSIRKNTELIIKKWLDANQSEEKYNIKDNINNMSENLRQVPILVKGQLTEILINLESKSETINTIVNNLQNNINKMDNEMEKINIINQNTNDIKMNIDEINKQIIKNKNSSIKGKESEYKLYELLLDKLKISDGFNVEHVGKNPNSCDILIKKYKNQNVRIECKDYCRSVNKEEVEKFYRDLKETKDCGIFISLSSGICGRRNIEIEKIDINQYAILISNNNYDIDIIETMLNIIYKLNDINVLSNSDNNIIIDNIKINKINNFVEKNKIQLDEIKKNLIKTIQSINEIKFDEILNIITDNILLDNKTTFYCNNCNTSFKSKAGLINHSKVCKNNNLKQSDDKQSDDKQSDDKQSDDKQYDDKQYDDKQYDDKQSDDKQSDDKQSDKIEEIDDKQCKKCNKIFKTKTLLTKHNKKCKI
jgi:hypothetical protein